MLVNTLVLGSGFRTRMVADYLVKIEGTDRYYSPQVMSLVNQYLANKTIFNDFSFREEVLKTTMALLNTPSLKAWSAMQGTVGINHRDFLLETFRFILGERRRVEHNSWIRMLRDDVGHYEITDEKYFTVQPPSTGNMLIEANQLVKINNHFPTTINKWLSHPGGCSDLLLTLAVIFSDYYQED